MLKDGRRAKITKTSVDVLPIFNMIQKLGDVSEHDMFNTYNMGIGLMLAVSRDSADAAIAAIEKCGESACVVGEITDGEKGVDIC